MVVATAVVALAAVLVAGQSPAGAQTSTSAAATSKTATLRTPWGHLSLEGLWDFRTVTPLERPAELAGKAVLTAEEAAEFERTAVESRNADRNRGTATRRTVNGTAGVQHERAAVPTPDHVAILNEMVHNARIVAA